MKVTVMHAKERLRICGMGCVPGATEGVLMPSMTEKLHVCLPHAVHLSEVKPPNKHPSRCQGKMKAEAGCLVERHHSPEY